MFDGRENNPRPEVDRDKRARILIAQALEWQESSREADAAKILKHCRLAFEAEPKDPDLKHLLGQLFLDQAKKTLKKNDQRGFLDRYVLAIRSDSSLVNLEMEEEALRVCLKLIEKDLTNKDLWMAFVHLQESKGNAELCILGLRTILEIDINNSVAQLKLAGLLVVLGKISEAIALYENLINSNSVEVKIRREAKRGLATVKRKAEIIPQNLGENGLTAQQL